MKKTRGRSVKTALPYIVAAAIGVLIAYLVVVVYVFPVDPDVVTPAVPSVVGETFEAASTKLANAGFLAAQGDVRKSSTGVPGTVLEQSPAGGTRLKVGSKVLLHTIAPSK
jgi:beta-lactam-binding protein with PASTA domain